MNMLQSTEQSPRWWHRLSPAWWSVIAVYAVWALMLSRDYWLGAPLLAVAWVATHIGAMGQNVVRMSQHKVGQPPLTLTWPAWTWQNFTAWYRPSIAVQWHHLWHDPNLSIPTRNLLLAVLVGILFLVAQRWINTAPQPKMAHSITHGSAHHASAREVAAFRRPVELPTVSGLVAATLLPLPHLPAPLRAVQTWAEQQQARRPKPPTYIPIGRYQGRMLWLSQRQQEEMILLTAPTGAGKTSGFIIPSLLSERGARSLYIPDPKSELWRLTSGYIARHQIVWRFAPATPEQSMCYNPLAYVTDRRSARRFADCFLRNTGGINERDMYWNNIATSLIIGVISHLHVTEPEAPLYRLITWFTTMTLDDIALVLTSSPSPDAQARAHVLMDAMQKNPKVAGAVGTDLAARWDHLQSEEVARVTARNDLDFQRMTQESIALYTSIATRDAESFQFLSACLVMQMFDTFASAAEAHGGRLPHHVMCYMDEFTNQGVIPHMSTYISTLRSAYVGMLLVVQSYAQIRQVYGDDILVSIQENCNTHMTLPGAGLEVSRYLSERIGDTTIVNSSMSAGYQRGDASSHNVSVTETRRKLILPEEIRTMPAGHALIVMSRLAPIMTRLLAYYETSLKQWVNVPPPPIAGAPELPPEAGLFTPRAPAPPEDAPAQATPDEADDDDAPL